MSNKLTYLVSACLLLAAAAEAGAAELTVYPDADTWTAASETDSYGSLDYMVLHGGNADRTGYVRFDLGALGVVSVQNATLTLTVHGAIPKPPYRNDTVVSGRFALYGLNNVAGNTPQNWDEASFTSADTGAEMDWTTGTVVVAGGQAVDLDEDVPGVTETVTAADAGGWALGTTITITGDTLVNFIQSRVDESGLVTFILKDDDGADRGYGICTKEYADEVYRPTLTLTAATRSRAGALNPSPANKATDVSRDAVLSWTPGVFAATHNVYFGTDFDDVNAAGAGVLVSQGQTDSSYDPPGHLEYGRTYYWRVDEVNGAPDFTVHEGPVWSFTVEPLAYQITSITATASSSDTGLSPENLVNGSGLDENGLHSTLDSTMWLSGKNAELPPWVQFEFDQVYKLHEMWVWNYNVSLETVLGLGGREVKIEYSADGVEWNVLSGAEVFNQGASNNGYAHNTTVDFGGAAARFVKLTILSNWGGFVQQYGLSEVQFFQIPVQAREPQPTPATMNVDPRTAVLSWKAGREAASHDVYLGTDSNAVADGSVPAVTVTQPTYAPPALQLGSTYYWKVVEVNEAATPVAWESPVWSFSTPQYLVVEDFESYTNDSPNRVFQTWIDGAGFSPDDFFPNGNTGNGSGSFAGYDPQLGDIMERGIVHGGSQSMPLYYDNSAAPRYSEAERTFAEPQDWSKYGITTLVLYFRGDVNNVSAPLYVKINGTRVMYNNGAPSTSLAIWKQWNIDLAPFGAALKSIKTLAVGVGDGTAGGTGTILIDDILLYAAPPQVVAPTDPGTTGLVASYSFENDVQDSSGRNLHGTANGMPAYVNGPPGMGKALTFDGVNDYVDLPVGSLVSTLSSCSFSTWMYCAGEGGAAWQRIFDFGSSNTVYMFLTSFNGTRNRLRFAITIGGNASGQEQIVNGPAALPTGWHHVAVVIDSQSMALRLYQDGLLAATGTTTLLPRDLGVTTQNWLGRSQYDTDPYLTGTIDELRIFDRALSDGEVRYLAGDR